MLLERKDGRVVLKDESTSVSCPEEELETLIFALSLIKDGITNTALTGGNTVNYAYCFQHRKADKMSHFDETET